MKFELLHQDTNSLARAGCIETAHGTIETPIFMPVGTIGSVKAVSQQALKEDIQAQIILGNNYHLFLRPGLEVLQNAGGLHGFMNWDKPILTDSGGYQVYSLANTRKIAEKGVQFASHIDGSKHLFTPENVIDKQRVIGSDIMMVLDECTPFPCTYEYALKSMELTHRWAKRAVSHFEQTESLYNHAQSLFPIVQGSTFKELRRISALETASLECEGNAIGGLSVGEPIEELYDLTEWVCSFLPKDKPRYLMGVGTPVNILESIARGIDMMDCVLPSRNARHGILYTWKGIVNIKNAKFKLDNSPIEEESSCVYDTYYSKAYLRHLFIANEYLGLQIATIHNLQFYLSLVKEARRQIIQGSFNAWKESIVPILSQRI